ncbi:uncharacterized protein LOC111357368 isoform X2 [Spodoptera litura]|nr:uncharacterized protein LOC111357368 isoform X2 [Spodoptera litura]XP_022827785.1 uncharacterized protein LOC111357368 isoform X2 [Spodoptera litura]
MNITNDGNVMLDEEQPAVNQNVACHIPVVTQPKVKQAAVMQPGIAEPVETQPQSTQLTQPSSSYATISSAKPISNTGTIPKSHNAPTPQIDSTWTEQIRNIICNHNQGSRILILMRGVPGSGKSYLARKLVDMMVGGSHNNYRAHILTTDDYFMIRGQYQYDKFRLSEAHTWNQQRARNVLRMGMSPVIIDNTNIELWEMEPYLREGVKNGYIIEVVEPTTPWAKKANILLRKNVHNVPLVTIKRMLENYREGVTGEILKNAFGLSYPRSMVPPVQRNIPCVTKKENVQQDTTATTIEPATATTSAAETNPNKQFFRSSASSVSDMEKTNQQIVDNDTVQQEASQNETPNFSGVHITPRTQEMVDDPFDAREKELEEIQKAEIEWENGDNWEVEEQSSKQTDKNNTSATSIPEAKPQRKPRTSSEALQESAETLMQNVSGCQDWSKISLFMPSWGDSATAVPNITVPYDVPVETSSSETCVEIGDTDVNGKYKVISATPRNINHLHVSFRREKIPEKFMLDKSSMTNEVMLLENDDYVCPNTEQHFISLRKMFRNIARSDLRDIFDKCRGDVNWSVDIVLDGMNNNQLKIVDIEELSDDEEESSEPCSCLAHYNIIPNIATTSAKQTPIEEKKDKVTEVINSRSQAQKKERKRDIVMSDENIQIKRQIEQNVVIADNHYSKHCLKIRKIRRGEPDVNEYGEELGAAALSQATLSDSSNSVDMEVSDDENSSSESSVSGVDDDVIVTFNVGHPFIEELDEKLGRKGIEYPSFIVPRISVPMSLLNEVSALWMESLTFQLDEHANQAAAMMQQDEDFARQLELKETEMSLAGKEPDVPDFKEIMDMDMALAIYQKDVGEWRNNMPTDLAAKMTRDKLFNLFPEVSQDTLTELLMAHDNNFNATVEVLLSSTGRSDVLEQKNGINKFVMAEEMKVKDKILEEQKKELSETEWPLLSKGQKVDMATVDAYREQADNHLARRNLNYQKAQEYIRRAMPQVANYYSELANFHKQKYEYANSMAAATLMQFHAANNPDSTTIDLHYLRVKEARESLDIFIDTHITKLRDSGVRRNQVLFFITGRGIHSQGRARIKPAMVERLKQRGLGFTFKNPGLVAAKVSVNNKLTYQVSVP